MINRIAKLPERYLNLSAEQTKIVLNRLVITLAVVLFIVLATVIVAFEDVFPNQQRLSSLQPGSIAPTDILAPETITYTSQVLTQQSQDAARAAVGAVYDPPDPLVVRQQSTLAGQILDYIGNVRRDDFADFEQKARDLSFITALNLGDAIIQQVIEVDQESWASIEEQVIAVLENVLRNEIRQSAVSRIRASLPNQVSTQSSQQEREVIVAIVSDLIRPNAALNVEATTAAQEAAAQEVSPETRTLARGQLIVAEGSEVQPLDFEALQELGLLQSSERHLQGIVQAMLASILVMVISGLYASRFEKSLLKDLSLLTLLAAIFLIVLAGARIALVGEISLYPTSVLALLFVAITGPGIGIMGTIGLAFLIGLMIDGGLQITALVAVGGMICALTLRRTERLNSFFVAGLLVALGNMAVVLLFNVDSTIGQDPSQLLLQLTYALLNGILTAAAGLAGLYIVTIVFNLPTALKLAELSQPNQPLLQRLLREAPGSYQHSLQVANLSEQAANVIGANPELTHVAALYHDIGKMRNAAFFTENQRDIGNPHDALGDPYRSADIIVGHVTEGDEMARQYRLPNRLRDFIREHHGTSEVYVFYRQAVVLADDDESLVDRSDFMYPGPRPQSRETAILMLADSCEAAVRSRQPKNKQEIEETINGVIDGKLKGGQLDESGLTMSDIKEIRSIFVEMLQAVFHPRINYTEAIAKVKANKKPTTEAPAEKPAPAPAEPEKETPAAEVPAEKGRRTAEVAAVIDDDDDDSPLAEVPRLRRTSEGKGVKPDKNGSAEPETQDESDKQRDQ